MLCHNCDQGKNSETKVKVSVSNVSYRHLIADHVLKKSI